MTRTLSTQSKFNLSPTLPSRLDGAEVDSYAAKAIERIRKIVGKSFWPDPTAYEDGSDDSKAKGPPEAAQQGGQDRQRRGGPSFESTMTGLLKQSLENLGKKDGNRGITLVQALRKDGKWKLFRQAEEIVKHQGLSLNAHALLRHTEIQHYLFAKAVYVDGCHEAEAVADFMTDESKQEGLSALYREVIGEAAQEIVRSEKIEIGEEGEFDRYLEERILTQSLSFEAGALSSDLRERIERYAHHATLLGQIQDVDQELGLRITPEELRQLINYVQRSGVDVDRLGDAERTQLIFGTVTKFRDAATTSLVTTDQPLNPLDFTVQYHTESAEALEVNRNNVLCAAQLFYVMTLGDELGVFEAADLLVRKHISRSRIDIQSQQVLLDLQNYALNDEFVDLATGRMYKRTNPEERRMFYRQVFNFGDTDAMEGMVSNHDFDVLWHALMLEDARYITAIRQSERPELYVSREGITQAVEALQYNLSTHCSGMAKVMTPVMYKELHFLIERILKSKEIISQLALHNSRSFMKVVERILQEEHGRGVNVAALQKKAVDGHTILEAIAKYTQAMIADDAKFSSFVRLVYAFITTGEKLEGGDGGLFERQEEDLLHAGVNGNANGAFGSDDWNF